MNDLIMRKRSLMDEWVNLFDAGLRTLTGQYANATRENPAKSLAESELTPAQARQVAGLMRVNHTGEICAQALYSGQALTAQLKDVRTQMQQASAEEEDHLNWCRQRLTELNSHTSYLDPFWYVSSLLIGAFAGWMGDHWSLGFVMATEQQVIAHLQQHLEKLPQQDDKTQAILTQMQHDEAEHAAMASNAGARELPKPIQRLMGVTSKLMTTTSYWF